VSGATFATSMLVALDRNEREAWVALRRLVNRGEVPTVPTVVTAQAWRDGRRPQLARALGDCRPEILGDKLARKAGELCRRSGTADIVDAVVIESAGGRGDDVYTGDVGDLQHLADYIGGPVAIIPIGS
jgi:hypothetical protein